jgi:hypothetical protein
VNKENEILTPEIRFHLIRRMERHKVIPLAGTRLLAHEKKYLEFHNVSGVILFSRNIESLSQIADLIGSVSEQLSAEGPAPLIMADHEGDFVAEPKITASRRRRSPSPRQATSILPPKSRTRPEWPCASSA